MEVFDIHTLTLTVTPFSLIGVAISIFLGFRNNASYDRYWEARKLWGRMVNEPLVGPTGHHAHPASRGRQRHRPRRGRPDRETLIFRQVAYVHGFRLHLRSEDTWEQLGAWLDDEMERLKTESNRPAAISQKTGEIVAAAWRKGHPSHAGARGQFTEITGVQGACERILATPVPFIYNVLMHHRGALLSVRPSGSCRRSTVTPMAGIHRVCLLRAGQLGDEIEEPFGRDPNDLPLTFLSRMIEVNLRQRTGDENLPGMHRPVGGVLDTTAPCRAVPCSGLVVWSRQASAATASSRGNHTDSWPRLTWANMGSGLSSSPTTPSPASP